jgi:hypothetical protein
MSDRTVEFRPHRRVSRDPTGRASVCRSPRRATRRTAAKGFTLVELMVSCAIAMIIIIGIELVFSISSKTIGAGEVLSAINRDDRAAQAVFNTDLQSADTGSDCPAFMIRSMRTYAFESASDKAGAVNQARPEYDPNFYSFNPANGGTIPVTFYNYRNHRIDRMAFFARNFFGRQTGGTDDGSGSAPYQYVSPTTSNEAYIWYGHVAQPDNNYVNSGGAAGMFFEPGDTFSASSDRNDNNAYATDWILGRAAIVLNPLHTADNSFIVGGNASGNNAPPSPYTTTVAPLSLYSSSVDQLSCLYQSRYDQAYTSIANFNSTLNKYAINPSNNAVLASPSPPPYYSASGTQGVNDWYAQLLGFPPQASSAGSLISGRFQSTPFPIKFPANSNGNNPASGLTNTSLAHTFPNFIRGSTQFIVEFAGNFYTKTSDVYPYNSAPLVTTGASPPDPSGQLDFQVIGGVKQVRWYGFPRHTNGAGATSITAATDVVPLSLFLKASNVGITTFPAFERYYPNDWATTTNSINTDITTTGVIQSNSEYVAAWGPDTTEPLPKMIRITLAMDDPNGNLKTPQWFEYVINLQP